MITTHAVGKTSGKVNKMVASEHLVYYLNILWELKLHVTVTNQMF